MAMRRTSLDDILPEARLGILRCVCGGAHHLPARSLRALALASSGWHRLSLEPEIQPFLAGLDCRLLTPMGLCKRAGHVWPPVAPLQADRCRDSEPLGERDSLEQCLRTCLRRDFAPARELCEGPEFRRATGNLETYLGLLRRFREQHFSGEQGPPPLPPPPGRTAAAPEPPEGASPPPTWCAAACVLPGRRGVCVAGGGCYSFELADAQTNMVEVFWHQPDVHTFDLEARRWRREATSGSQPPAAHTYATADALIGRRWLFWCGGYYSRAYNSAFSLDVETWTWRELRNSSAYAPCPRYFVASFEHNGALFAWGGRGTKNTYCNDLWRLDPSRVHQDVVHSEEVCTSGAPPLAKFAATLTNCDGRFAVLFGGGQWKQGGMFKADTETFTLELTTFVWTRLEVNGPKQVPRCQHSAVNLGGNLVLVLGGYDGVHQRYLGVDDVAVLNVRSLRWMSLRRSQPGSAVEELRRGMRVRLRGLTVRPELNGMTGTLVRFEDGLSRWLVRLDGGAMDTLFVPAHLEAVDPGDGEGGQGAEDGGSGEESPEERRARRRAQPDMHAPPMLSPICEGASGSNDWIRGQFPFARAGIALATDAGTSRDSPARRSFYMFGGAQYVHQEWYADLYECSLQGGPGL